LRRRNRLVKTVAMLISVALTLGLTQLAILFNKNRTRKPVRITIRTDRGR